MKIEENRLQFLSLDTLLCKFDIKIKNKSQNKGITYFLQIS